MDPNHPNASERTNSWIGAYFTDDPGFAHEEHEKPNKMKTKCCGKPKPKPWKPKR